METLQIHPTMECNRQCGYCSYATADKSLSLPFDFLHDQVGKAVKLGITGLKISGGGEPLLYKSLVSLLCLAKYYDLKVYLQTNGDKLSFLPWKYCDDIRVSLSDECSLESRPAYYAHGFSYVVTASPNYSNLCAVVDYAIANDRYIKITQDDTDLANVPEISEIRGQLPPSPNITYWDAKEYHQGLNPCSECMLNPLLGADGYYYPCCRTQYAKGKNLTTYDETMRLGTDIEEVVGYDGSDCVRCCYE